MKKLLITLTTAAGLATAIVATPAQSQQQTCPPGQAGNFPYCETPPPPPPSTPLPPACGKFTSKLSLARATVNRLDRNISILAPITKHASGDATIALQSAGRTTTFSGPVDSANGRVRVTHSVTRAQALLGTGILTFAYAGDADTRPQVLRLRAASNPARLRATRPTISPTGRLEASGIVTIRAQGVVRIQLEYINRVTGATSTLEFNAPIDNGRYNLSVQLPAAALAQLAVRCGTVHSYTLFTGYLPGRIRGEMKSFQVLGPQ